MVVEKIKSILAVAGTRSLLQFSYYQLINTVKPHDARELLIKKH